MGVGDSVVRVEPVLRRQVSPVLSHSEVPLSDRCSAVTDVFEVLWQGLEFFVEAADGGR